MEDPIRRAQALCLQASNSVDLLERNAVGSSPADAQRAVDTAAEAVRTAVQQLGGNGGFNGHRLQQLNDECEGLKTVLERRARAAAAAAERAAQRRELIGDCDPVTGKPRGRDERGGPRTEDAAALRHLADEEKSLRYSRARVQRATEESYAVLDALRSQRRRMEKSGTTVSKLMESLGVGNETLLQIARRGKADAVLVYCGIALLLLLMFYLWFG